MSSVQFNTRVKVKHDTTANWNAATTFIPLAGEVIVYDDYQIMNNTSIPGIKVGDGLAYVVDLPFITEKIYNSLYSHINNTSIHVATVDRNNWDNKISAEVSQENLILTI